MLKVYFLIRLPLIFALKALFPGRGRKPEKPGRILIIRLDRLGDLVLSLPFIASLRAGNPSAKIDMLVRPYLADLAESISGINDVIVYRGRFDALKRLPGRDYDIAIDMYLGYRLEPALAALFSKAAVRIGFDSGQRGLLFTAPVDIGKCAGKGMVEADLELLKPLGVRAITTVPRLRAEGPIQRKGLIVAIHPGGYYASQRWAPGRFAAVARMVADKFHARILVIGGRGERALVERVAKNAGAKHVYTAFPSMRELVGLLQGCNLLICNNSGPLHLAASLGVPTVSVMGPTDPALWWPRGENQSVIRKDVGCGPCSRGTCGKHSCLELITAEEVFNKARELMERVYGVKGYIPDGDRARS